MDERVLQFRVGVMVFASICIAIFLVIIFNYSPSLLGGKYTVYIRFPQAPGVTRDTPVRKSGVLIGRVSNVKLLDEGVLVTTHIDSQYKLYENEVCQVTTESLLGGALLEFVPGAQGSPGEPITDDALITGEVRSDPMQALEVLVNMQGEFRNTMSDFRDASSQVGALAENLNTMIENNQDQVARVVQKSELALDKFDQAMTAINQVVGDDELKQQLKDALSDLPALVDETRVVVGKFGSVADTAQASLKNAEKFTATMAQLGESTERISGEIDDLTDNLNLLIQDLLVASDAIKNQEGTVGMLIYNPELYQRLNKAAENVEEVTGRLKPIVDDVRVFSDKIARDPGRLGLKGLFQRDQTGIKHLPMSSFQSPMYIDGGCADGNCYDGPPTGPVYLPDHTMQPAADANGYVLPPQPQLQPAARAPQIYWQGQ